MLRPVLIGSLLWCSTALAEEVCVASAEAPFRPVAADRPIGMLAPRHCYAVLERAGERVKAWVPAPVATEVWLPVDGLAWALVDDLPLRPDPSSASFGLALSGTVVRIVERRPTYVLVEPVEGRVRARFAATDDQLFPASTWPEPDRILDPGKGWPVADRPMPPSGARLKVAGGAVGAEIRSPLVDVRDLLLDPDRGGLRWSLIEPTSGGVRVRIVGRTLWVEGTIDDLDWREDAPDAGWALREPAGQAATPVAPRAVGAKEVPLALDPKADPVATLAPGTRVAVLSEDGGFVQVSAAWPGGLATGWVEKKRLEKEGKEAAVLPTPRPVATLRLADPTLAWAEPDAHLAADGTVEPVPRADAPLRRAIHDAADHLRLAYARLLAKDPARAGEILLRVGIAADGTVDPSVVRDTLTDGDVTEDVLELLRTVKYEAIRPVKRKGKAPSAGLDVVAFLQLGFAPTGR